MPRLGIHCFSISLDGYGAGPRQDLEHPLGAGGLALHDWMLLTQTFRHMAGQDGGTSGVDDDFVKRGLANIGAWILGRNMFAPVRGPWRDDSWKGWWGNNPPYHAPVFVLTHHARKAVIMEGGTEFRFVSDIHSAFEQAVDVARSQDVRLGGGVATIRQYLHAGLVDEMHVAIAPVLLGSGEHLLYGLDLPALGYECTEQVPGTGATHIVVTRRA